MLNDVNRNELLGGVLRDEGNCCCGNYRGFNLRLQQTGENSYLLLVPACSQNDPQRASLNSWLQQLMQLNSSLITEAGVQYHNAIVGFLADSQEALKVNTENIAGSLVNFLAGTGYQPCCEVCGQPRPDVAEGVYNGSLLFMCGTCAASVAPRTGAVEAQYQAGVPSQANAQAPEKSNALLGTAGALIGALAGGIVWFVLDRIGIIAGIAGFAMAYLSILLYGKLGGTVDRKGVIICLVATFGMVCLANHFSWAYSAYSSLKSYGYSFSDCFIHLWQILKNNDLTINYLGNLGIGMAFTIFSTFKTFAGAFASTKKN